MFKKSRSKRANQNAHVQVPPTSAAAIAALQATGAQSIQDGRLAAGAAAAALRSHTSSPVNVGEVQTRRMVRRASITSATSDTSFQHGRPGFSRSDSVSSMTSRTFRSPSPYGMKPVADVQPPVPPVSRSGATSPSSMTTRSFRRPASTEPVARTMSPTPAKNLRNMSIDTATRRVSRPTAIATANLGYGSEKANGSRNSVNFSRPMSPDNRPISPAPASPMSPAGRRTLRSGSVGSRDGADSSGYKYQEIANKSVKKKQGLGGDEGSHLAAGTMGTRATGTVIETGRPKRMPLPRRISEEPDEEEEFEEVFDPHTRTMVKRRKPNWRPKAAASPPQPSATATKTAPVATATQVLKQTSPVQSLPSAAAAATAAISLPPEPKARDISASPARKARFSLRPEEHAVIHEPARSLTPTKSALRKSPSPRGLSPAEPANKRASWNQPGFTPSEVSETASHLSDDRPKRKSVRVSFDDQPTIVGTSTTPLAGTDSPTILSPQHDKKKGWFSLRKKTSAAEENEEKMAPIPTLPSFGSVRGRRPEAEEAQELNPEALGIPGVALTTGEQTPSEAGSHADEGEGKGHDVVTHHAPPAQTTQADDATETIRGEDVPIIAIIPGTPGIDNGIKDPMTAIDGEHAPSSPVRASSPAALGISEPEPEAAAAAHDPSLPVVGHVAETIKQQTDAGEKLETDSQDSHYSDAPEDVDGDGFGSINAIVESPVISPDSPESPDSPKKKLAEALPPLTDAPPAEIAPVPAVEAAQGAEATKYRELVADPAAKQPLQHAIEREEVSGSKTDRSLSTEVSPAQQKPQVESVSYNPRRVGSTRSSQDAGSDGPRRFAESLASRNRPTRSWSPDSDEEDGPIPQSSAYPTFQKSPRHSFQGEAGSGSASPNTPPTAATDVPSKRASIRETPASSPVSTNTPSSVGRSTTEKKPLKSALKQTNRPSVSPETLVMSQPRGALQKKPRPVSVAASSSKAPPSEAVLLAQAMAKVQANRAKEAQAREADVQGISQRARAASLGAGSAPVSKRNSFIPPMPKLGRRGSDASDSSFRRGPASVTSEGGRVSMRRSMRATNSARPQSMVASGSFRQATRSEQAPRSRPTSMLGGGGFGSRTMRSSREPSPTRSILSFRKSRRPASVQGSGSGKRVTSRFNDDSDDDDVMPTFASRFDDSDDDKSTRLRPVRGIPRRTEEVDSSDLDSEADAPVSPRIKACFQEDRLLELARQRLGIEARPDIPAIDQSDTRLSQADLVTAFAEKPNDGKESKRKSFFGALGRRKTQSKVKKDVEESIARRDTHLERTALQRNNTGQASLTSTPDRPKPSRQTTAERAATLRREVDIDSWPLPESPTTVQRPETSDGSPPSTVVERPKPRRNVSADGSVLGRTGKKKKFPFLRKAFGLHD